MSQDDKDRIWDMSKVFGVAAVFGFAPMVIGHLLIWLGV